MKARSVLLSVLSLVFIMLLSNACSSENSAEVKALEEKLAEMEQKLAENSTTSPPSTSPPSTTTPSTSVATRATTTTLPQSEQLWKTACSGARLVAKEWSYAISILRAMESGGTKDDPDNRTVLASLFDEVGEVAGKQARSWDGLLLADNLDRAMFSENLYEIERATYGSIFTGWKENMTTMREALAAIGIACSKYSIFSDLSNTPENTSWG